MYCTHRHRMVYDVRATRNDPHFHVPHTTSLYGASYDTPLLAHWVCTQ